MRDIDRFDMTLLELLRLEGTASRAKLTEMVGRARETVYKRSAKCKALGYIGEMHMHDNARRGMLFLTRKGNQAARLGYSMVH